MPYNESSSYKDQGKAMSAVKEKYNIIVVDDAKFTLETLSHTLKENGYNVTGLFDSAQEAINFINESSVHIALIDVVMPKTSGFELAKAIIEKFKKIQIIMMSSLSQERIIIESISSGASDFLQKPIQDATLFDSLNKVIKNLESES